MIELFKKPIIPARVDAAWAEEDPLLAGLSASTMLVLTRPFCMGSREEATLTNMLRACGFAADAVAVIQVEETSELSWLKIGAAVQPTYALLLGVPPAQLGIAAQLAANAASEFGGVTIVWTSTLQYLAATDVARKSLWMDVLQPLFKKP